MAIFYCESSKLARFFIVINTVKKFRENGTKKLSENVNYSWLHNDLVSFKDFVKNVVKILPFVYFYPRTFENLFFFFQVFLVAAAFGTKTCKNNVLREIQKRYYAKSGDFYISLLFLPHSNITTLVLLNKDKRKALTL